MCIFLCERQSMHTCTSRELIFLRNSFFAYSAQVCVHVCVLLFCFVFSLICFHEQHKHTCTAFAMTAHANTAHGLTIAREQTEQRDKIHTLDDDKRCWAPERQNSTQQYYNIVVCLHVNLFHL